MNPAKPWKSLRRSTSDTVKTHTSVSEEFFFCPFFLSLIKGEQDVEYRNPLYEAVIILRLCKIKKEESHCTFIWWSSTINSCSSLFLCFDPVKISLYLTITETYYFLWIFQVCFNAFCKVIQTNIFLLCSTTLCFLNSKRMSYTHTASHHYRESLSLVCLVTFVTPLSPSFNDLFFSHISRSKCLSPPLLSIWLH